MKTIIVLCFIAISLMAGTITEKTIIDINNLVNTKIKYTTDIENYGVSDYWAKPAETLKKGMGDCEDIAILKYNMLEKAGMSKKDINVIYTVYKGKGHIYLEVTLDGKIYNMDNIYHNVYLYKHVPMINILSNNKKLKIKDYFLQAIA